MTKTIINVRNVSKVYKDRGIFSSKVDFLALEDVSLDIYESETLALVGESGCGKTTLGKLILGILEPTEGSISYRGQNIFTRDRKKRKDLQKNMQMVFQDPYSSLNTKLTIKSIIEEPIDSYKVIKSKDEREKRIIELLESVGLRKEYLLRYPRELSG
ncbi:MAG: ATP-binding cassette domain-containing protein, partial [Senegalia sp. (in: firmicutes)]